MRESWSMYLPGARDACLVDGGVLVAAPDGVWLHRPAVPPQLIDLLDDLGTYPGECDVFTLARSAWDPRVAAYCLRDVHVGLIDVASARVQRMHGGVWGQYHPDLHVDRSGARVLAAADSGYEWDVATGALIGQHEWRKPSCALPDGGLALMSSWDQPVLAQLDASWRLTRQVPLPDSVDPLADLALVCIDEGLVLAVGRDLLLLDPHRGTELRRVAMPAPPSLATVPGAPIFAAAAGDRVGLYDGALRVRAEQAFAAGDAARVDIDGQRVLAFEPGSGRLQIWDLPA